MTQHDSAETVARGPRRAARRAVRVDGTDLVRSEILDTGPLPLVLRPGADLDPPAWIAANLTWIEARLVAHGAILFRGFGIDTVARFERFVTAFTPELLNYVEGSSPRTMLSEKVYTSTEYPPEFAISLHNELSYSHAWPGKVFFCCVQPPLTGGETPIADGRRVLARLPADLVDRFARKGVCYLRNLHGGQGAGLSWMTVFETTDRHRVESYCRAGGIEFQWREDGGLRTRQVRPALARHPKSGEMVWFNQADQWHASNLGAGLANAMANVADEANLPLNVCYGDGSTIDPADLDVIRAAFREVAVVFPWQAGDALVIDNTMVSHGRMPFTGPRRVLVSMGDTVRLSDIGLVDAPDTSG